MSSKDLIKTFNFQRKCHFLAFRKIILPLMIAFQNCPKNFLAQLCPKFKGGGVILCFPHKNILENFAHKNRINAAVPNAQKKS